MCMNSSSVSCERSQVRDLLIDVLSAVWRKWKVQHAHKIHGIPHTDVFAHRVKVAGYEPTFARALEKLCHGLSLQSVFIPPEILHELEGCEKVVLDLMRNETVFLTAEASSGRKPKWKEEVEEDED